MLYKPLRVILSLLFILAFLSLTASYSNGFKAFCTRVVDGDTIVVRMPTGKLEKVRLLCVNTPESVHRDKKQNIPMGKTASRYTETRLEGKAVDLEFEGRRRGNYGRLLAYVIIDGVNFNIELVKQGLSPYYTKYGLSKKYDRQFREAERYARKNRLNIWGDPQLARKYLRLKSKWGQRRPPPREQYSVVPSSGKYVGSKKSNKFHYPSCRWAKKISPGNRVYFNSRQEALDRGYVPCKVCGP